MAGDKAAKQTAIVRVYNGVCVQAGDIPLPSYPKCRLSHRVRSASAKGLPVAPLHRPSRTDAVAVAAMETVRGVDAAGKRSADTARRTDDAAPLTADTLVRIDAVSAFPCGPAAKGKALAIGRKLSQVKILPLAFVNPKDFQRVTAFSVG